MKLLDVFDANKTKAVFDHIRNLLMCALLIAAGVFEGQHRIGLYSDLNTSAFVGWGLIAIGVVLAVVNLLVGLSQLSKLAYHRFWMALVLFAYVMTSLRAVVVLTAFRSCN
ncbi:MAG: hypothetical protein JSS56_20510 [Proteobacteria bacterium]|nr:hypothetical protein [Pseudomonadota bacterium]